MYIDWRVEIADIGCLIGEKEYWGKGVVYDCMKTIMDFAFYDLDLFKIFGSTAGCNIPVIFNCKKLGMNKVAELKDHVLVDSKRHSLIFFSIYKDQWVKQDERF